MARSTRSQETRHDATRPLLGRCGFPHRYAGGRRIVGTTGSGQAPLTVRSWLSRSHSGVREVAAIAFLYGLYEVVRGAGGENVEAARQNTADIVALEQAAGVYVERGVQESFEAIPFAPATLGLAYVLLHFVGTAVALVWVHRRHPDRFPLVRTTFIASTALALVGYVLYPAAPPRLAELGFSGRREPHAACARRLPADVTPVYHHRDAGVAQLVRALLL